ncbi:MAG: hypothetical protein WCX64_04450 [Candidatus Micrarchaeia archaeon]
MEIKQIVKEMLSAGMPESEILANLTDLGIPDAPRVLAEAKAAAAPKAAAQSTPAPKPAARPAFAEEPEAPRARSSLFSEDSSESATPGSRPSLFDEKPGEAEPAISGSILGSSSLGSDQKIDELVALTKSLLDLNKKILESNREILLRLSK